MGRNISIVMLDFFVVMTVVFFLLLYLQDDRQIQSTSSEIAVIKVEFRRGDFYSQANILSIPLRELIDLDLTLQTDDKVYSTESSRSEFKVSYSYDAISAFYAGPDSKKMELTIVPKDIKSAQFVTSQPEIIVTAFSPSGLNYEKSGKFSVFDDPVLVHELR